MCQEVVDSVNQCECIHIQKYMKAECWTVGLMHLSKQVVCMEVIVLCGFQSCVCVSATRAMWQALAYLSIWKTVVLPSVCVCVHLCVYSVKCIPHVGAGLSPSTFPLLSTNACRHHTWVKKHSANWFVWSSRFRRSFTDVGSRGLLSKTAASF